MKPARIVVICIAAVSAIGLALVVRAMGSSSNQPAAPAAAAQVETRPMAKVLVAAKDLEPGQRLVEGDLAWKDWPVDEVNPVFITDGSTPVPAKPAADNAAEKTSGAVEGVAKAVTDMAGPGAKSDYIGSVVREPILAGEPIVARKIVRAGDSGYLAAYLEPGMRAMAIAVTVESAAGGFILPGDRVDVLQSKQAADGRTWVSETLMRNLRVLAIDQKTDPEKDARTIVGAVAVLEVPAADAEVLSRGKAQGEMQLALRSYADLGGAASRGVPGKRGGQGLRVYRGGSASEVLVR